MSTALTAPGVYVQELPSGSRAITGVSTSLTAFVGSARRGDVDAPTPIASFEDFTRRFGGLAADSPMSHAVRQYFVNGGAQALIVRVVNQDATDGAETAVVRLPHVLSTMVIAPTATATALPNFDHLELEVSAVATTSFTLTVRAKNRDNVDLPGTPSQVFPFTAPPPAGDLAPAAGAALATVLAPAPTSVPDVQTVSTRPQLVATIDGLGLVATEDAHLIGATELSFTVRHLVDPDEFELHVEARNATGVLRQGTVPYAYTVTLHTSGDMAGALAAAQTHTETPVTLVHLRGTAPAARPALIDGVTTTTGAHRAALVTSEALVLSARNEGDWGNNLRGAVSVPSGSGTFHLTITELGADKTPVAREVFRNLTLGARDARGVARVLELESRLARVVAPLPVNAPDSTPIARSFAGGEDGEAPRVVEDLLGSESGKTGIYALLKADLFNLLCIPLEEWSTTGSDASAMALLWSGARTLCESQRAFLLIDPPTEAANWPNDPTGATTFTPRSANAALYLPRLLVPDPLQEGRLREFPPCGAVAGIIARTDGQRGVWKAPAGLDGTLLGVPALTMSLTDAQQGRLNPLGINCLRQFPGAGTVIWGARTLRGADAMVDEWKFIPVRRLALYLHESLYRGTQWAVFEPNAEPLWGQLRLSISAFMHQLFRQGAFQGTSPRDAYLVKCDADTTTSDDIDRGIVNIIVGFAPVKPAEFVIIKLQQIAERPAQ